MPIVWHVQSTKLFFCSLFSELNRTLLVNLVHNDSTMKWNEWFSQTMKISHNRFCMQPKFTFHTCWRGRHCNVVFIFSLSNQDSHHNLWISFGKNFGITMDIAIHWLAKQLLYKVNNFKVDLFVVWWSASFGYEQKIIPLPIVTIYFHF